MRYLNGIKKHAADDLATKDINRINSHGRLVRSPCDVSATWNTDSRGIYTIYFILSGDESHETPNGLTDTISSCADHSTH